MNGRKCCLSNTIFIVLEKKMNKISMLSIALSLMAGFAYAEDAKTEEAVATETTATTTAPEATTAETPAVEATPETPAADVTPVAVSEKPVVKKAKKAKKVKKLPTKEMKEATEALNSSAKNTDDEKAREAVEKLSDAEEVASDARVAVADAKKDAHLQGHTEAYSNKLVEKATDNLADADKKVEEAKVEVEATQTK